MSELSHTQIPPGGWIFVQPQTGWRNPSPISSTFDQTVQLIIKMRRQNAALCVRHNLSVDIEAVGKELDQFTRRRLGMPNPTPPPVSSLIPGMGAMAGAPVAEIKRLAQGAALLIHWQNIQDGPVDGATAEARAAVCAVCPQNNLRRMEQWRSIPVAAATKNKTPRLETMNLKTSLDSKLGVCDTAFVPCGQLVHAPSAVIVKRLKEAGSVDAKCWIRGL